MVTERKARRRFRPGVWPTLAVLGVLPVLIGLGLWQLDRAEQKIGLRDERLEKAKAPPVELGNVLTVKDNFRRARGSGRYREQFGFLLDNQVYKGRAGYHVLTPFVPEGATQWVLIDRGWIPWGPDREQLPAVATPSARVAVAGRLVLPVRLSLNLETAAHGTREFTHRWQRIDPERLAAISGSEVAPVILQLDAEAGYGYVREWPVITDEWIDRHKAYALQWFGLAVVLLLMYLFANFKRDDSEPDDKQR